MKFNLVIYTAFDAQNVDEAEAIASTIKSTIELRGLIVDETVLNEDKRISIEEAIKLINQ
jgi:hypothetical protein